MQLHDISIQIERKNVKNMRLVVYPDGRVRLSLPMRATLAQAQTFLQANEAWMRKKLDQFAQRPRPQAPSFNDQDLHFFQGIAYPLRLVESDKKPRLVFDGSTISLFMAKDSEPSLRQALIEAWYRREIKQFVAQEIERWQPIIGVQVAEFGIRQMKTRWGTCNIRDRRIWINLELIKYRPACLEYVVVHELVHLLEREHNARFWGFVEKFLPEYKKVEQELKKGNPSVVDL